MEYKDPNKREARVRGQYMARSHMKSSQSVPHYTDRHKWFKKNFGFLSTHILRHHSSKNVLKPALEATVSRRPDAGLSEESDQPPFGEPGSMELTLGGNRHGSTEEPIQLSGIPPTPTLSQNASNS